MDSGRSVENNYQVHLRGHCLFCLQQHYPDQLDFFSGRNIRPFQLLLNCTSEDKRVTNSSEGERRLNYFPNLPPTCQSCFAHFEKLQELHEQLISVKEGIRKKVGEIKEVVHEADSSKWNTFKEALSSCGLPGDRLRMTFELVRNIQRLILTEVQKDDKSLSHQRDDENFEAVNSPTTINVIKLEKDETVDDFGNYVSESGDANSNDREEIRDCSEMLSSNEKSMGCDEDDDLTSEDNDEDLGFRKANTTETARKRPNPKGKRKRTEKLALQHQSCDLCGSEIPVNVIFQHIHEHVKDYATKCSNTSCPCVFSSYLRMIEHLKLSKKCREMSPSQFIREAEGFSEKCEVCSCQFKSTYHLQNHLNFHEAEMDKYPGAAKNECPIPGCNKAFYISQNVQYHLFQHDLRESTTKRQNCSLCGESIELPEMETHLKELHEITETFKCNYCGLLFGKADDKIRHVYEHRDKSGVACDICCDGIKLTPLPRLRQHYLNAHLLGSTPELKVDFTNLVKLHQREHGDGEVKRYKCGVAECEKEYKYISQLIRHEEICRMNEGMRPHICEICGRKFKREKGLKDHKETFHLGIRPRCVCDECGESFKNAESLRVHKLIHSGEMPHVCNTCGQAFRNQGTLWRHEKSHQERGESFKPHGSRKHRKRVKRDQN